MCLLGMGDLGCQMEPMTGSPPPNNFMARKRGMRMPNAKTDRLESPLSAL